MIRQLAAGCSAAAVGGAALLVGGRPGLIGGAAALLLLGLGLAIGSSWLVTTGPAVLVAAYLLALVLARAPADPEAPLLAMLLFVALEGGHLSLEGERYDLPGGPALLWRRLVYLAAIGSVAFATGWALLLLGRPLVMPAVAGTAAGAVALIALMGWLRLLRRSVDRAADVHADSPAA